MLILRTLPTTALLRSEPKGSKKLYSELVSAKSDCGLHSNPLSPGRDAAVLPAPERCSHRCELARCYRFFVSLRFSRGAVLLPLFARRLGFFFSAGALSGG